MRQLLCILIICLWASLGFSARYLVDCSLGTGDNDGTTAANAFQSLAAINAASFSAGDDLYFKQGTTCTASASPNDNLEISWNGVDADNYAIIGCWESDGDYDCSGTRPIIDGVETYPVRDRGLVRYRRTSSGTKGYIHIKDLQVLNSDGQGIEISHSYVDGSSYIHYTKVSNCYTDKSTQQGILFGRAAYNEIYDNEVRYASYVSSGETCGGNPCSTRGAGIEISGLSVEALAQYNHVHDNKVHLGYEGIGIYKGARYTTVEHNAIWDNRSYMLYAANTRDNIFRFNLLYQTGAAGRGKGIVINCEGHVPATIKVEGDHEIYGNLIAGVAQGIALLANCEEVPLGITGTLVYANTIIDSVTSNFNINVNGADAHWSGNLIKNNISWIVAGGGIHTDDCGPAGTTWDYNLWDTDPGTGNCDAANDPANADPTLAKSTGWTTMTPGAVIGTEFMPLTSSNTIDAGVAITNFNDRISAPAFNASPITLVTTDDTANPDIGASKLAATAQKVRGIIMNGIIP